MPEDARLEFKEILDPSDQRDRLVLVKEIVAMANAEGGRILVGVSDNGTRVGMADTERGKWDPAEIGNLLDSFLSPDCLDVRLEFTPDACPPGRIVVEVHVPQHLSPPLVLCKDGNHAGADSPVFRKNAVLVRHNTKVETARRSDFLHWRDELRSRILQQFQMVVEAPETAHLRVVGDEEVRDEPQFLLSRAADLFRQRREKLLDGDDLLYLFRNRAVLDLSGDSTMELLLQSALRRRATLFFWLALTKASAEKVGGILETALDMSDRDKSDMAGAIPLVAAVYLSDAEYREVVRRMEQSSYAHIREAAIECPSLAEAKAVLDERRAGAIDGIPLSGLGDDELLDKADELASAANMQRVSRRMPQLGLEYLARKLDLR